MWRAEVLAFKRQLEGVRHMLVVLASFRVNRLVAERAPPRILSRATRSVLPRTPCCAKTDD